MALSPSPGKHQRDHGETPGAQSQPTCKTMLEMAEAQVSACECNPALVRHQLQPKRPPDRVLEVFLQEQKIGRAKPVVLIAAQRERAIDVLPAECLLKIKRHRIARRIDGLRKQQS